MRRFDRPQPTPGHPIPRGGKVYIWTTWLAKLLGGGDVCVWSVWFKSRFQYAKLPEKNAEQLQEWNREHNAMMLERAMLLEEHGYVVRRERDFKLEGNSAIIAGKKDIEATLCDDAGQPQHVLIVDGKTGKRRDSDFWQVLIYLYARLHSSRKPAEGVTLAGEVLYERGGAVDVRVVDVEHHEPTLVSMIKLIASPTEPPRNPSRYECDRCNIRPEDCPVRYSEDRDAETVTTGAF